jgi:tripartite-type tricarboxylate transporter receptor subunit TctC
MPARLFPVVRLAPLAVVGLLALLLACAPAARPSASAPEAVAAAPAAAAAPTDPVADFYRNKTFRVVVGYAPGGGWDNIARTFARHFGPQIPGNPRVVVENVAGAGGLVAANQVLKAGPQDGTAIVSMSLGEVPRAAFGDSRVEFDYRTINWLGTMESETNICFVRRDLGIQSVEELRTRSLHIGALAPGTLSYQLATFVKNALNTKIEIVSGYDGSQKVYLAMEQGELDGYCITRASVLAARPDWITGEASFGRVIVQMGLERDPALPNVPYHLDLARTPEERELFRLALSDSSYSRPMALGASVPPERVQALRAAFLRTMEDPAFLADAQKIGMSVQPRPSDGVAGWVQSVLDLPPEKLALLKQWLSEPSN